MDLEQGSNVRNKETTEQTMVSFDEEDMFSILEDVPAIQENLKDELQLYLEEETIPAYYMEGSIKKETDILRYWKENSTRFPVLGEIARIFLSIPASSGEVERLFSAGGVIKRRRRNRLKIKRVENLLLVKDYYTSILSRQKN